MISTMLATATALLKVDPARWMGLITWVNFRYDRKFFPMVFLKPSDIENFSKGDFRLSEEFFSYSALVIFS